MGSTIENIKELSELTEKIYSDTEFIGLIDKVTELITNAYKSGNKTIFCGNGGSSAEAQHLAADLPEHSPEPPHKVGKPGYCIHYSSHCRSFPS